MGVADAGGVEVADGGAGEGGGLVIEVGTTEMAVTGDDVGDAVDEAAGASACAVGQSSAPTATASATSVTPNPHHKQRSSRERISHTIAAPDSGSKFGYNSGLL